MFKYFKDPHHFAHYHAEGDTCNICGERRPGYAGPFFGKADIDFVCEPCLAAGRLAESGNYSNDPDVGAMRKQLREGHPDLDEAELESVVKERTEQLIRRTPQPATWQHLIWPAHCGDYCCYLKEAGTPDLEALAPGGDGKAFFADHLLDPEETDADLVWEGIRPDSPRDSSISYTVGVYLFQCRHCGEYLIHWDCE